jgi:hypothetical protein
MVVYIRKVIYPHWRELLFVTLSRQVQSLQTVTFNSLAPLFLCSMKLWEHKKQFILQSILSFLLLGIGGSIYLLFRPKTLLMFKWFESLGLSEYIDRFRDMVSHITLNHITLYSLPDGLWLASYIIVVNTIVSKSNKHNLLFWSFLLPFIAIVFELLQIPGVIPGVFDVFDLVCYITPLIIYLIYLKHEKYI